MLLHCLQKLIILKKCFISQGFDQNETGIALQKTGIEFYSEKEKVFFLFQWLERN